MTGTLVEACPAGGSCECECCNWWEETQGCTYQGAGPAGSDERSAAAVREERADPAGGEEPATKPRASPAARSGKRDQGDGASEPDRSEDRPDRSGGEGSRARSTGTIHPADRTGRRPRGGGRIPSSSVRTGERSALVCGDCDDGMAGMRPGSVDIIFTDPPYIKDLYADAYQVLARHAGRLLVPGGYLVTYCPQFHLPAILRIMDGSGLAYFWLCAQLNAGAKTIVWSRSAMCGWKPVVIYQKPPVTPPDHIFIDVLTGARAKAFHPWQQSIHETLHLLSRLAAPGALVLDPFAGSGTNLVAARLLGMDYYGFEIDPATCRIARERLTQRPLDLGDFLEVPA